MLSAKAYIPTGLTQTDYTMYRWRKLTDEDRREVLEQRIKRGHPVHSPQHIDSGDGFYHLTGACFEHSPYIGHTTDRMNKFAADWLDVLHAAAEAVSAWVVLPNHYHALVRTDRVLVLLTALGKLHGRTSHEWNGEEATRGR